MKYDKTATDKLVKEFNELVGLHGQKLTVELLATSFSVPERSIIAKLSSLGLYVRKEYRNKRGEVPVRKEEYLEIIADSLGVSPDKLESLEKAKKSELIPLTNALK